VTRRLLTNSMRRTFTQCRRKYFFVYPERLSPIVTAPPLSFGQLVHDCLEDFHINKNVLFDHVMNAWEIKHHAEVDAAAGSNEYADVDHDKIADLRKLATGMMQGYVQRYANDLNTWRILACEKPFRYPISTFKSGTRGRSSATWDFGGKIDLLFADQDGSWILENKTTQETDKDKYETTLMLDTQPIGYVWGAEKLIQEMGWPPLRGIIYNVLRKKLPADPHPLKCKSCKGSGQPTKKAQKEGHTSCPTCNATGVVGISTKQSTDTTVEKYVAAIRSYPHLDINDKDYEDVISMLTSRGDRFFWRFWHPVSLQDIEDWERETYQITRDIDTCEAFYRNVSACSVNGRKCPYRRICLEDDPIARRNFIVRDTEHPELKAEEIDAA